jgi:hypothetical protein
MSREGADPELPVMPAILDFREPTLGRRPVRGADYVLALKAFGGEFAGLQVGDQLMVPGQGLRLEL